LNLRQESSLSKGDAVLYKGAMPKPDFKFTLAGILFIILYFLFGVASNQIHNLSGMPTLIWLPTGLATATLVLFGKRFWPWVFLASTILNTTFRYSLGLSTGIAVGAAVQAYVAAHSLNKISEGTPTLTKVREVIGFGIFVMGIAPLFGMTIQAFMMWIFGAMSSDDVYRLWHAWWLSQATSCLVIAAPCICWWNDIRFRLGGALKPRLEALVLGAIIVATCLFIYTPLVAYNHSLIIRPFFLFSLMIWAAVRFDIFGATSTIIALVAVQTYGNVIGFVSTSGNVAPDERMILQQYFTMALGLTGLVISAAIREKDAALEARSEFLSIASHELKTPIAALSLQLQVAERKLRAKPDRDEKELEQITFLDKTGLQVFRLVQIVEQLLDVSKIDRKVVSLQFEKIDLGHFVQTLVERLENNLKSAQCTVSLHLQNGIECEWDSVRFEQVFENLISNATKYAPGKLIRIETKEVAGIVEIAVRDGGPGIDKSKQAQIFERFVRANSSPQIKGLGLGLFITRQIIEAHGGKISVESKPGEGTSFLMKIPAHPTAVVSKSLS
jgi:signal transduction histidine kinase